VVFFVDEVDLGVKFLDDLLVHVLIVLHRQLLIVLAALIKLAKP
jgi:hypothetical protein